MTGVLEHLRGLSDHNSTLADEISEAALKEQQMLAETEIQSKNLQGKMSNIRVRAEELHGLTDKNIVYC